MSNRAACLALSALASSCYLASDTESVMPRGMQDAAVDMDAAMPIVDARVDATTRFDAAIADSGFDAGCQSDLACAAETPVCSAGKCIACKQQSDCSRFPATPACGPTGACVLCTATQSAACTGATPACDEAKHECVQCLADSQCTTPAAAGCDPATHTCGKCSSDAQCSQFGLVCNTDTGACVACRPGTEKVDCHQAGCDPTMGDCPGYSCSPVTFTCGNKLRNTLQTCQTCISDSECLSTHRCVPMHFGADASMDLGGHCLEVIPTAGCLHQPYTRSIARTTISGQGGQSFCGLDENATSCAAVAALFNRTACTDATSCNAPGALCRPVGTLPNACTYQCSTSGDCNTDAMQYCGTPSGTGMRYCGGGTQ